MDRQCPLISALLWERTRSLPSKDQWDLLPQCLHRPLGIHHIHTHLRYQGQSWMFARCVFRLDEFDDWPFDRWIQRGEVGHDCSWYIDLALDRFGRSHESDHNAYYQREHSKSKLHSPVEPFTSVLSCISVKCSQEPRSCLTCMF